MDNASPPSSLETPIVVPPTSLQTPVQALQSTPGGSAQLQQPLTSGSPNARMTVFPRAIRDRALIFSYPPKVGVRRRGSSSSSSGASSSSHHRDAGMVSQQPPTSFARPRTPSSSIASVGAASTSNVLVSQVSPSVPCAPSTIPTRFITRSFLIIPDGTRWSANGVPAITHWPSEPCSVVVTLPDSKKWAGVNYPQEFPVGSVEFCVAESFSTLPQYQNSLAEVVTGTFFKRTKKQKGVGSERAYKLEPYVQEAGAVYGKLNANTVIVYLPNLGSGTLQQPLLRTPPLELLVHVEVSPLETPLQQMPPFETTPSELPPTQLLPNEMPQTQLPPLETPSVQLPPSEWPRCERPSSSSEVIDLTLPPFQRYAASNDNYLDHLSDEWIHLQEAYFAALERKNKKMCDSSIQDCEDLERSSSFWKSFGELEAEVRKDTTSNLKNIILELVQRKELRRGIKCSDADINKVTAHITMQRFTPVDLKLEYEKNARLFWREWDNFDDLIKKAPKDAKYLDLAHVLLHSHGEEGQIERVHELEDLFKLGTNNQISLKLLELMCRCSAIPKDVEEEELLHRRKEVEVALLDFQRYFLEQKVFYSYMSFCDTSRLVPTTTIKVYQGKEYQAFCDQWREVSFTNNACYKVKVEYIHNSGIHEKNTIDEDGLQNSWLTNCWKQFISMPYAYNSILEYPNQKEGAILHPMKDVDVVWPDIQLDTGRMIGHLIWEIASKSLEVNRPFTYSTLLMICDQVPQSKDLTSGIDLQLRSNLERDFRLCFPSKWSILHQLRQSFSHATMLVVQLAEDEINEELGWSFVNFELEESNWIEQVEKKLGSIMWSHLFKGRELVVESLREGFFLSIETAPISASKKEKFKRELLQLTPECLKIAFSGSCSIEAEQFMKAVKFETTISERQQIWFKEAVYEMTHSERMRLVVFITGWEFFGGSQMTIALLNRDDDPCIQSSTCFGQLYLPPYSSYETMMRMIKYSTMDTSYGRP